MDSPFESLDYIYVPAPDFEAAEDRAVSQDLVLLLRETVPFVREGS